MSQAKSQPCINCGSERVKTTDGKRETACGDIFHVQRICRGCRFMMRMRWGNDSLPDTWEPSGLGRHTTYMFLSESFRERGIGIVSYGVLLVGDEKEIGSTE